MDTELLKLLGTGLSSAGVVMALVWGTVEWALPITNKHWKRFAALVLGIGAVMILQESHFVHFGITHEGTDEHNRLAAVMFGVLAGGLAPVFHTQVIARFIPGLKKKVS